MSPSRLCRQSEDLSLNSNWAMLVAVLAVERLTELTVSRRHQAKLRRRGYRNVEPPNEFRTMVAVHIAWFFGLLVEPVLSPRQMPLSVQVGAVVLLASAQLLRLWAIATLGDHWNVNVMQPTDASTPEQFVAHGPYRYLRHPNYLAVVLEIAAVPLLGGALVTGVGASLANGFVLRRRIDLENQCLAKRTGYEEGVGRSLKRQAVGGAS